MQRGLQESASPDRHGRDAFVVLFVLGKLRATRMLYEVQSRVTDVADVVRQTMVNGRM
jgi:hypothetical protein